jgi:hypothetical protein
MSVTSATSKKTQSPSSSPAQKSQDTQKASTPSAPSKPPSSPATQNQVTQSFKKDTFTSAPARNGSKPELTGAPSSNAATTSEVSSKPPEKSFSALAVPPKTISLKTLEELGPKAGVIDNGPRTKESALKEMDELLRGDELSKEENSATVLRDAPHVNDAADTNPTSARHKAAAAQVEANQALEEEALKNLSTEDQKKYEAVKQTCVDQNDPVAELALQKMLLEGKLPGAKDLQGGSTTLDHLAKLADTNTPLAEGVDRNQLVTDLVQEIATPSSIAQRNRGTCAPTTIAIDLAMNNPAEYVRIASGLASPEGKVTLAGGQELVREEGTAAPDGTPRSVSQRLMGSAFMEFSNGKRDYENSTGKGAGAWADDLDPLFEAVYNRDMSAERLDTPEKRAQAMNTIADELASGQNVPVALEWGGGGDAYHKVLVTGTETVDGKEYVKYINPWGREERMEASEFERRLADISYGRATVCSANRPHPEQPALELDKPAPKPTPTPVARPTPTPTPTPTPKPGMAAFASNLDWRRHVAIAA